MAHRTLPLFVITLSVAYGAAFPDGAHALQPLDAFLRAAQRGNFDNREAAMATTQRTAESDVARGKLYPSLAASGSYTRNQYEVALQLPGPGSMPSGEKIVIQPYNQLDANLSISIPLIDVSAWKRLAAANASVEVSQLNERVAQLDVDTQVSRSYYQLLGQEAVLEASKRALSVAHANLELVQTRAASGAASELELQRGRAEVARAEGDLAAADFAVTTARRQLSTATWLDPEPATGFIEDDLHEEAPLATWMLRAGSTPRVQLAEIARQAAEKSLAASKAAWLPTLSAAAQERFTNATGFAGYNAVYTLQASLSWRVDASVPANVRAQDAALATSALRRERAERAVQDTIYQAWHQVRASIERSRAARAQVSASRQAVELARDRYSVGAATQLDVIQAQQEAFRADVSRIQADTELAYARLALRTSTGTAIQGTQQ